MTSKERIQERTQMIISKFTGNKNEFQMLKGILCMNHGWTLDDDIELYKLVDMNMIAERLDELNGQSNGD